ncbi:MAG: transposase [Thermoplasmatota archaeon]
MCVILMGFCTRGDLAGVTSLVRTGWLAPNCYRLLLHAFHGNGIDRKRLIEVWTRLVLAKSEPTRIGGHLVAVCDGLKVGKEGRRMPGVKSLHQESQNNSKAPYIMGHSYQTVGLLVTAATGIACIPLASRLHAGIKSGPGEKRTILDQLVNLFLPLANTLHEPCILVADAYYASRKIILPLLARGHHLVTRAKTNAVAHQQPTRPTKRARGRPRKYGKKVQLSTLWNHPGFQQAPSPVYGETNTPIRYLVQDLVWRPIGRLARFVLVDHPRGRIILMTTKIDLDPLDVIRAYGYRFKIEVSFKQALHTLGAYAYHFWLKSMPKIRRGSGDQYLHRATPDYRARVHRKIAAYELHVQLGLIAQGMLQLLAIHHRQRVWQRFQSWLRTMNTANTPSEAVAAQALRATLPEFLLAGPPTGILTKFLHQNLDWTRTPGILMTTNETSRG